MLTEHLHVDHCLVDVAQFDRTKQTFDAINDFKPAAVTKGKDKSQTGVASSLLDGFMKLFLRTLW